MTFVEVVLLRQSKQVDLKFTYKLPAQWLDMAKVGTKVQVPFGQGNQTYEAIITAFVSEESVADQMPLSKVKDVSALCDQTPWMTPEAIALAEFIRWRYVAGFAESYGLFMPSGTKLKREIAYKALNSEQLRAESQGNKGFAALDASIQERVLSGLTSTIGFLPEAEVEKEILDKICKQWLRAGLVEKVELVFTDIEDTEKFFIDLKLPLDMAEKLYQKIPERFVAQKRLLRQVMVYGRIEESVLRQQTQATTAGILKFVEQGVFSREAEVVLTLPELHSFETERPYIGLSEDQKRVFDAVVPAISQGKHQQFYLHGVTGSGKTEVYMEWVDLCLQLGRQALMLVPEISLTPQMIDRFKRHFGENIAVFHSRLSQRSRFDQWRAVQQGKLNIVIGARSALFAPFQNLGLIIVDEAHEGSYKSDTTPKYHGVQVASEMGRLWQAPVVMGSATPAVGQYFSALAGELELLELKQRFSTTPLPSVDLVDMREELASGNRSIFSKRLFDELEKTFRMGKQAMLLMNRKGFSTYVACRSCGFAMKCPDCEVALTYHKGASHLKCNYCQYRIAIPKSCPSCGSPYFKHFGTGTEKVLETLNEVFPNIRAERIDSETTARKGELEAILGRFERRETDVLIGTQMISKGLDFKDVRLVGVIAADLTLNLPDFQAAEKTFALLTQVAGRAGRSHEQGHVVIQTYEPDHFTIKATVNHDYHSFYKDEIRLREAFKYPPFYTMASLLISSVDNHEAQRAAMVLCGLLKAELSKLDAAHYELYEASPAVYAKIKNRYRWQIVIKYKKGLEKFVTDALRLTCFEAFPRKGYSEYLRIILDPDATSIL